MAVFTLAQKVFVVQSYYKGNQSAQYAKKCLVEKYGAIFGDPTHLVQSIMQIVKTFEKTGSILNRFYYGAPQPQEPTDKVYHLVMKEAGGNADSGDIFVEVIDEVKEYPQDSIIEIDVPHEEGGGLDGIVDESFYEISKSEEIEGAIQVQKEKTPKVSRQRVRKEDGGERPKHECDQCPKTYKNRTDMIQHKRVHHTRDFDKFICEICGKVSSNKYIHKSHMLIHTSKRDYSCPHCPLKFKRPQGMKRHIMTHTGEKPLKCKVCGASFLAHMTLNMHMRLHTGERPYTCKYCDRAFIGPPSLNAHLKLEHAEEYLHVCGICNGRFKTEKTLKDHFLKRHGVDQVLVAEQFKVTEDVVVE